LRARVCFSVADSDPVSGATRNESRAGSSITGLGGLAGPRGAPRAGSKQSTSAAG